MLQDEAFHFLRIGSFLERADNTARLLDVKFHAVDSEFFGYRPRPPRRRASATASSQSAEPEPEPEPRRRQRRARASGAATAGGKDVEFDFYHWSAVLRSVSGFEVYRKVYRNVIRPEKVAELLILRARHAALARRLHARGRLEPAARRQRAVERHAAPGRAGSHADLQYGRIDEILATGLHAYLTQFLERVNALGVGISRDFLVPVALRSPAALAAALPSSAAA